MRFLKTSIGIVLALAVFMLFLTSALQWVTFDLAFYERELRGLGVAEDLQVDFPTFMTYVESLTEYLQGNRPSPNMLTVVRGRESLLFGERETHHMEDVRSLFALAALIRNLSLLLVIVLVLATVSLKAWRSVLRIYAFASGAIISLLLILAVWAAIDFNSIFTVFHLISFSNDLWLLDPATENLIVMFPEQFFAAAALRIALAAVSAFLLTLAASTIATLRLGRDLR